MTRSVLIFTGRVFGCYYNQGLREQSICLIHSHLKLVMLAIFPHKMFRSFTSVPGL